MEQKNKDMLSMYPSQNYNVYQTDNIIPTSLVF